MNPISIMTFFGVLAFILVMLFPAIIELKKPKDSGPRMIFEEPIYISNFPFQLSLPSLEADEDIKINPKSVDEMMKALAALPMLDF
ncbi:MAG: hypothetical protein QXM37_02300 [Candidatus Bathyarchaeia archaeon]